jgi:hypothetical protein
MVNRVPGFSIDEGSSRRGFGGVAGNVLIDGARPSAKNQSLNDLLSRIPAKEVVRVELIRAAASGEAAGQAVVVNVVRQAAGFSGVYELDLEHSLKNETISPRLNGAVNARFGDTELSLGAERWLENRPLDGGRTFKDGTGRLLSSRIDDSPRTWRQVKVNAALATPLFGGRLRLNGEASRWRFGLLLQSDGLDTAGAPTGDFRFTAEEREREREIGGDYERDVGPLTVKLVALDTLERYANNEVNDVRDASGARIGADFQRRRNESREQILRASASWPLSEAHRVEFGAETALNTLTTQLGLEQVVSGVRRLVDLPNANVGIEEERAEAFLTHAWTIDPRWSLESGLTVETSTIAQSGDNRQRTELTYWKPALQLARKIGARDQLRLRLLRDVSQLDFGDFASSSAILDGRVAAGNPNLRPQALWRTEATYDHRFGEKGALTATLFYDRIEDAADLVPLGPNFDGPGNLGEAREFGLKANATVPIERFLPGAQIAFDGEVGDSEVTDPFTRRPRELSGDSSWRLQASFRQDLPGAKLSWGVSAEDGDDYALYRRREVDVNGEGTWIDAFVRTTAVPGVTITLRGWNLGSQTFIRERTFYAPDRNGRLDVVERRTRNFGRFVQVEVSGTF